MAAPERGEVPLCHTETLPCAEVGTELSPVELEHYVDRVAQSVGSTKIAARTVLEAFLLCLREDLSAGRWILLRHVGSFRPVWYRYGRQPIGKNGQWQRRPGRTRTMKFKPVAALRLRRNSEGVEEEQ